MLINKTKDYQINQYIKDHLDKDKSFLKINEDKEIYKGLLYQKWGEIQQIR